MASRLSHILAYSVSAVVLSSLVLTEVAWTQAEDVVIVTARKTEQSIQDVPLAITALGALELQAAGFEDIINISKAAPGLFIESINGTSARVQTQPRFRGITFDSNSLLQRTATVFVDGILTSGGLQSIDVNEVERVEIIKGPQSALFGRNTYSGAINYITKDPSSDFGGHFSALAATRDKYNVSGGIEGGLIGDTLTGRISGAYNSKGGHYDNAAVDGQELGEETDRNVNATLAFAPTDNFKLKLRGTYYETDDGPAAVIRVAGLAEHNFGGFNFTDPVTGLPGVTETAFRGTIRTPRGAEIGTNTGQADFDRFLSTALADGRAGTDGEGIQTIGIRYEDLGGFGAKSEAVAIGRESSASGGRSTAIGTNASATGGNTLALGRDSNAGHNNSAAIGFGATTTLANQMVFGTTNVTYVLPGLTSAASNNRQSGDLYFVTTDEDGNLGTQPVDGGGSSKSSNPSGTTKSASTSSTSSSSSSSSPVSTGGAVIEEAGLDTSLTQTSNLSFDPFSGGDTATDVSGETIGSNLRIGTAPTSTPVQNNTAAVQSVSLNSSAISVNSQAIDVNSDAIQSNKVLINTAFNKIDNNTAAISKSLESIEDVEQGLAAVAALPDMYLSPNAKWSAAGGAAVFGDEVGFGATLAIRGNDNWTFGGSAAIGGDNATGKVQVRYEGF